MSGELEPGQRDLLMSDADRERVVARLHTAVSEGRITLSEFQERVDGVLRARRYGEVEPFLAGLPIAPGMAPVAEIRTVASSLKRRGSWPVPQKLMVYSKAGSVKLDFTEATISSPVVEVVLDVYAASTTLVLPVGATADVDQVEMVAGSIKAANVPREHQSTGGVHFVVTGTSRAGSVKIRHKRHFLWWQW